MEGIDLKEAKHTLVPMIISDYHNVHTMWSLQMDQAIICHISASKERQRQIHMVLDGLLSFGITHGILIPGCGANDMQARIDHDRSLIAVLEGFD